MVLYYPGEYAVEQVYTVDGLEHKQLLTVRMQGDPAPGTDFSAITVVQNDAGTIALDAMLEIWNALWLELYSTATTVLNYATLWKYVDQSYERSYVSSWTPVISTAGGSATPYNKAQQNTYTFRTFGGNLFKLVFLETIFTSSAQQAYADIGANEKAIVDHVLGDNNCFLARDDTRPIAFLRASFGRNEKTFRQRWR